MATKLKTDFREPSITGVTPLQPLPREDVFGKIGKDLAVLATAFVKDKAANENALAKSFDTALKLHIESNTKRIQLESENDAAQIKEKLEAFRTGLLESIPESKRFVAAARIDAAGNVSIAQANKNLREIQNSKIAAEDELSQGNSLAEWKTANEGLLSEDIEISSAARNSSVIIEGDFFADLQSKAIDVDGNEIISPEEANKRIENFQRIGTESGLRGRWHEGGSTPKDLMEMMAGRGPKEVIQTPDGEKEIFAIRKLKGPDLKTFLQSMEDELKFNNEIINKQDKAADEQKKIDQGANVAVGWILLDDPDSERPPLTHVAIVEGIQNETFGQEEGLRLLKATLAPEVIVDDQNTFNMISEKLERNEDVTSDISLARAEGLLTGKSARSFGTENEANIDRVLGVMKGPRKTLVDQERQNLSRNLKTQADFAFIINGKSDPAGARRTSQMMTEFNRRTQDPEVDPVAVQLELSERGRIDTIDDAKELLQLPLPMGVRISREKFIKSLTDGNPQILKEAAQNLARRFTAGDISEQEYKIQRRFIFTWLETLGFFETAIADATLGPEPSRSENANK